LRVLFFKLCKFLQSPITWIFVFDGPLRPNKKRSKSVNSQVPSWRGSCQSLLKSFGFAIHQAPGEGEAELAKLNASGFIDAVLSTDSDSFVFGAQCVIRRAKMNLRHDEFGIYHAHVIEHTESVLLSTGGLLLLALVLGGDYSSGLEGCGVSVAHALAKSGFGDSLLEAAQSLDDIGFELFRQKWISDLRNELTTNTYGHLRARQPKLASNIPANFPERSILELYCRPLTSFSPMQILPDISSWKPREPKIKEITTFCYTHLGWRDISEILGVFHRNLWEGVFLQMLYSV
ncbi:hypothetical protein GALMADRAFT_46237, partial [Galerina marginata CBS 339.88]